MPVLKVGKNRNVLNEEYAGLSAGYSNITYNTPGFSYSIMPLQFNLQQKGNDPLPLARNKAYRHHVGDMVKGYCPYDKKTHRGIVQYLYYTVEDSEKPRYCYILDMENNYIVMLDAGTVRKVSVPNPRNVVHADYMDRHAGNIGYDLQNYSPVPMRESVRYDFNKNEQRTSNMRNLKETLYDRLMRSIGQSLLEEYDEEDRMIQVNPRIESATGLIYANGKHLEQPLLYLNNNSGLGKWVRGAQIGDEYVTGTLSATCVPNGTHRRVCCHCGHAITDSCYVVYDGDEYYCSNECLFKHYPEKYWMYMQNQSSDYDLYDHLPEYMHGMDSDNSYYTEYINNGYFD